MTHIRQEVLTRRAEMFKSLGYLGYVRFILRTRVWPITYGFILGMAFAMVLSGLSFWFFLIAILVIAFNLYADYVREVSV